MLFVVTHGPGSVHKLGEKKNEKRMGGGQSKQHYENDKKNRFRTYFRTISYLFRFQVHFSKELLDVA